ncbi:hypothetical protein DSO57_1007945 [Entomophthora muscae]|uniref:Uncharacterized protein n=2 Tax=Entomophthora muscae TaxID=34485 RepID=A0ACC2SWX1_9FUNG|nr:hypothetical protein DSO57_1007945 [Entomophthora muscae]
MAGDLSKLDMQQQITRVKTEARELLMECCLPVQDTAIPELLIRRWESARRALSLLSDLASLSSSEAVAEKLKSEKSGEGSLLHEDTKLLFALIGLVTVGGICPNLLEGNRPREAFEQINLLNGYFKDRRCMFSKIHSFKDFNSKRLIFTTWNLLKLIGIAKTAAGAASWIGKLILQKKMGIIYAALLQIVYGPKELASSEGGSEYLISPKDRKPFQGYLEKATVSLNVFLTIEEIFMLLQQTTPTSPVPPKWLLSGGGMVLSDIFKREHGLTYVVKFFSNNFFDEETGFNGGQLQSISGVILAPPSSAGSSQEYYKDIAPKLLALLQSVCTGQPNSDRGAASLVAYIINQLFLKSPSITKSAIFDVVMAPFRTFWKLFESPHLLSGLGEVIVSENELSLSLSCLRHLVLESDATYEQMQQLIFPYLAPLFELYTSTETWTTTGMPALFVEELLCKYFSYFPDTSLAGNSFAGILTSKVATRPLPAEFRPGRSGFCLFKKSQALAGSLSVQDKPYPLDLNVFVCLLSKLDARGSVFMIQFMSLLLENLNEEPLTHAIYMHTLVLIIQHYSDKLKDQAPRELLVLLAKLMEKFGREYLLSENTQGSEDSSLLSLLINTFSCVLDANHTELENADWCMLRPVMPVVKDLCDCKRLSIQDIRRCHSIKLLMNFSLEGLDEVHPNGEPKSKPSCEVLKEIRQAHLLLNDPLVSVRASGIHLLEHVASSPLHEECFPSTLDEVYRILMKSIEDDDSYIYLAAVKAMSKLVVNSNVLPKLVEYYLDCTRSMDFRLRVGEALLLAISWSAVFANQRCNDMIGAFLFALQSSASLLKGSALSLISAIFERAPTASLPYVEISINEIGNVLRIESDPTILRPAVMLIYSIILGLGLELLSLISPATVESIRSHLEVAIHRSSELDLMATCHAKETCRMLDRIVQQSLRPEDEPASVPVQDPFKLSASLGPTLSPPSVPKSLILDLTSNPTDVPDLDLATRLAKLDM